MSQAHVIKDHYNISIFSSCDNDIESKFNACRQCNEWERKYVEIQERCAELSRENSKLRAQLLSKSDENIDTLMETIEETLGETETVTDNPLDANLVVKDEVDLFSVEKGKVLCIHFITISLND